MPQLHVLRTSLVRVSEAPETLVELISLTLCTLLLIYSPLLLARLFLPGCTQLRLRKHSLARRAERLVLVLFLTRLCSHDLFAPVRLLRPPRLRRLFPPLLVSSCLIYVGAPVGLLLLSPALISSRKLGSIFHVQPLHFQRRGLALGDMLTKLVRGLVKEEVSALPHLVENSGACGGGPIPLHTQHLLPRALIRLPDVVTQPSRLLVLITLVLHLVHVLITEEAPPVEPVLGRCVLTIAQVLTLTAPRRLLDPRPVHFVLPILVVCPGAEHGVLVAERLVLLAEAPFSLALRFLVVLHGQTVVLLI
mmetsp:Transcript_51863/g.103208  ORF Transcript_51863/g.103208 Transcript_51863/m.103208 type:complete len:306 (-) Transcript_51863:119-1036(-)